MNVLKGAITQLRFSVEVNGSGDRTRYSAGTTHVAIFQIGKRPIVMKSANPLVLNEHDEVVVAGPIQSGTCRALAYRNLTNGAYGGSMGPAEVFVANFFLLVGAGVMVGGLVSAQHDPTLYLVAAGGSVFALAGYYFKNKAEHVKAALKAVFGEI